MFGLVVFVAGASAIGYGRYDYTILLCLVLLFLWQAVAAEQRVDVLRYRITDLERRLESKSAVITAMAHQQRLHQSQKETS